MQIDCRRRNCNSASTVGSCVVMLDSGSRGYRGRSGGDGCMVLVDGNAIVFGGRQWSSSIRGLVKCRVRR